MSTSSCDEGNLVRVAPSTLLAFDPDATPTRDEQVPPLTMHLFRESRDYLVQRWIGHHDKSSIPGEGDSEEQQARQEHDYYADLDWELEEFEREVALRFVMRDLRLGLEGSAPRKARVSESNLGSRRPRWTRSPSSTSTLQPLAPVASSSDSPLTPTSPATPATLSSAPTSPPPATPRSVSDPSTPRSSRPTSLLASILRPPHKSSPSVLSLPASHFSSCTTSSGPPPSISARSFASQVGRKIKGGIAVVPIPPVPSPRPKSTEVGAVRKKRRVSVPVSLAPKRRRLIVRGIGMDDEYAIEGVQRWAEGLGEVSRITRGRDGAIWIEFQEKRVAENVCCLQAQVQIPHVGRVVLDWAEGRHPG